MEEINMNHVIIAIILGLYAANIMGMSQKNVNPELAYQAAQDIRVGNEIAPNIQRPEAIPEHQPVKKGWDLDSTHSRKGRLDSYAFSIKPQQLLKCSHPGCTRAYLWSSALEAHQRTHSKLVSCSHCALVLVGESALKLHLKSYHPKNMAPKMDGLTSNPPKINLNSDEQKNLNKTNNIASHFTAVTPLTDTKTITSDKNIKKIPRIRQRKKNEIKDRMKNNYLTFRLQSKNKNRHATRDALSHQEPITSDSTNQTSDLNPAALFHNTSFHSCDSDEEFLLSILSEIEPITLDPAPEPQSHPWDLLIEELPAQAADQQDSLN
jgi:hypothetical protein